MTTINLLEDEAEEIQTKVCNEVVKKLENYNYEYVWCEDCYDVEQYVRCRGEKCRNNRPDVYCWRCYQTNKILFQ